MLRRYSLYTRGMTSYSSILVADRYRHLYLEQISKEQRFNIRSSLMKTLEWSVETLGSEYNLVGLSIHLKIACET